MINVLIVDDMKLLRESLKLVIGKDERFYVIGTAGNGLEALDIYAKYQPDLVLMDLNMPIYSGHEAIRDIKKINENAKIIVLSVEGDEANIYKAFANGADGYVLKDIEPDDLFEIIQKTFEGKIHAIDNAFSLGSNYIPDINIGIIHNHQNEKQELTLREKEVLKLVSLGLTNEEIAGVLGISTGRTKNIVADLIAKCMVKNRTQLAVIAVKRIPV